MIDHLHAASVGSRGEVVFVVPELVRSGALFIDEVLAFAHVRDLGQPSRGYSGKDTDAVFDHLAGVHARRDLTERLKPHRRGGEAVQIARRGEELPDESGFTGNELRAMEMTDHTLFRRGSE